MPMKEKIRKIMLISQFCFLCAMWQQQPLSEALKAVDRTNC